jgi:hypothetical protein
MPVLVPIVATIARRTVALEACSAAETGCAAPLRSPDQAASSAVSLWLGSSVACVAPPVVRSSTVQLFPAPPTSSLVRWRIAPSWTAVTVEPAGTPSSSQVRSIDQTLVAFRLDPAIRASSAPDAGEPSVERHASVDDPPAAETHPSLLAAKSKPAAVVAPSAGPTRKTPMSSPATAATSSAGRHRTTAVMPPFRHPTRLRRRCAQPNGRRGRSARLRPGRPA